MRILWFEVSVPSAYKSGGIPIGGWQDSLERIVRTIPEIELNIAFVSEKEMDTKVIDGVRYYPMYAHWSFMERTFRKHWDVYVEKMIPEAKRIVEECNPDLIQVFGTEWPLAQIATYTDIPVVVHIMGAIVPYRNAYYPPGYSFWDSIVRKCWNPKRMLGIWLRERNSKNWEKWERKTWNIVQYYMGRTYWDKALSSVMHPDRVYFHVEEALRTDFLSSFMRWEMPTDGKMYLVSTGCSTFWKGPDMMLKVARILCELGVDFEWRVAGRMDNELKTDVEHHEGISYEECHIRILGFIQPVELINILCSSTMYVHTAYIENSPNSICEAQCLGVPVVSTNVGGIASLLRDGVDGVLVPANDPWQMADAIIHLSQDKDRMRRMSLSSAVFARSRHADENIKKQLLDTYKDIICRNQ